MSNSFRSPSDAARVASATRAVERGRFATPADAEVNETVPLQAQAADGGVGTPAKRLYWDAASDSFQVDNATVVRVVQTPIGVMAGYTKAGDAVYASGGSSPCTPGYVMVGTITGMACDGFGSNMVTETVYSLYATGCVEAGKFAYVAVSGTVLDADDEPIEGVEILGHNANPNGGTPPEFVVVATTGEDGTYSGFTTIVLDITSPTPSWYVQLKASGYTPSETKIYLDPGPVTVDFAP